MIGYTRDADYILTLISRGRDSVHCHETWPQPPHELKTVIISDICQNQHLTRRINDNTAVELEDCSGICSAPSST